MRREMVETYIRQLRDSLGSVRQVVPEGELRVLYERKDFTGMAQYIRNTLGLNMGLRLGFVNKGGPAGAPAWIATPVSVPLYGTEDFCRMTVTMYIRKSFLRGASFESVVLAMAHELCHVVLYAIGHEFQDQEEAVDLTAMMLGYRNFYCKGCWRDIVIEFPADRSFLRKMVDGLFGHRSGGSVTVCTHHLGYLTLEEVKFASGVMEVGLIDERMSRF